jgi:hypothetical protein
MIELVANILTRRSSERPIASAGSGFTSAVGHRAARVGVTPHLLLTLGYHFNSSVTFSTLPVNEKGVA